MSLLNRRRFLVRSLESAGMLAASGLLDRNSAAAAILRDVTAAPIYTRRNIYCLNAYSSEVVAYKAAITAMQALPATNGRSWMAQANIHGAFAPPAGMIADACEHGSTFFLSWHRMYVYFFERIVRKLSGDANFALPYWGYSPTGSRNLPAVFRTPATAANPLYTANRNASMNGGANMTASQVQSGSALTHTDFTNFTNSLNGTPHGAVHNAVGGGMSSFEEAGQDPIFWLHHCNIDRLWEVWLGSGGGRVNPITNTSWMTTPFNFYDENGATVTLTGAQIVDTVCQLRYQYESDVCRRIIVFDPRWWRRYSLIAMPANLLPRLDSLGARPPLPQPRPIALSQQQVNLGSSRARVALTVPAAERRILSALPRDSQGGGRVNLVLDNVRLEGRAQVFYEVYINLPDNVTPTSTSPHYVGNVNLFGPSPRGRHVQKHTAQIIPLSVAYLQLRDANLWSDDTVRVTFVPRPIFEGQDPVRLLGQRRQATIGSVAIQIQ
jgi:hypothetical protein